MSHSRSTLASKSGPATLDDIKGTPLSVRTLQPRQSAPASPVDRVRGEFAEMRGFSPTLAQAARLFDLPREECDRVLRSLVKDGSLIRDEEGRYRLV